MLTTQNQLKEVFYFILSKFKKPVTQEAFLEVCSKSPIGKYLNETNVSEFFLDGYVSGYINKPTENTYAVSPRGLARSHLLDKEDFKFAFTLALDMEV